jgi:phospholipid/cholesterol/gamma-HCH transport system substrate-binding protein
MGTLRNTLLGNGRQPTKDVLVVRGVLFLVAVALLVGGLAAIGRGALAGRVEAVAVLDSAGGSLVRGADVKYDGVVVGEVTRLAAAGSATAPQVRLDLRIEEAMADDVPRNVTARILPASIFGTSFVDLVPPADPAGALSAGQEIAQDTSRATLELQTLLDGLDRVVTSLGPADLAGTLEGLAGALDGRGETLGETMVRLEAYLGKLNPSLPLVRENLALLAGNLEAFRDYAPALFDATDDALVAARTLVAQEARFRSLMTSGRRTLDATTVLLRRNEQALVDALAHTAAVVDVLYDGRRGVVRGLLEAIDLGRRMVSATSHGRFLRVDGNTELQSPPEYGRGDCPSYGGVRGRGC